MKIDSTLSALVATIIGAVVTYFGLKKSQSRDDKEVTLSQLDLLKDQLHSLIATNKDLQAEIMLAREERIKSIRIIDELTIEVGKLKEKNEALGKQIESLERENIELTAQIKALRMERKTI